MATKGECVAVEICTVLTGSGGRGVLAAGRPYQGYLTWGVTASQSDGWTVNATFEGVAWVMVNAAEVAPVSGADAAVSV